MKLSATSLTASLLATVVGTLAALALVRGAIRGRAALNALIIAPLVVPVIIYAIAVLFWFGPLRWTGTLHGFVLAHSAVAVPYVDRYMVGVGFGYRLNEAVSVDEPDMIATSFPGFVELMGGLGADIASSE